MASFSTNYSIPIPTPDVAPLEQLAQFTTPDDGLILVYWIRNTQQVVLEYGDQWYIQNDGYITDSIAQILNVKESVITIDNLCVGNIFDSSSFKYSDPEMSRHIYTCCWSDYTCDYLIMQADINYPYDAA